MALHRSGRSREQTPSDVKEQHPDVAWSAATRLRNRIVHGYWSIDVGLLVATAVDDVPTMVDQISTVLDAIE